MYVKLDERERATVLAALRLYKRAQAIEDEGDLDLSFSTRLATRRGTIVPLTRDEIEVVFKRFDRKPRPIRVIVAIFGGVCTEVYSDAPDSLRVSLLDHDDLKESDAKEKAEGKKLETETEKLTAVGFDREAHG